MTVHMHNAYSNLPLVISGTQEKKKDYYFFTLDMRLAFAAYTNESGVATNECF